MSRDWTPAQRSAIDARGQDVLVSAAAGSGKTAVLTQRIIERITAKENPLSVDELLVVTYTKAAAGELKKRIRDAILEQLNQDGGKNRRMRRQLLLLEQAEISTIHSFCFSLIRKNVSLLSLPANLRVADEGETSRIAYEVMERLLADLYKQADPGFLCLTAQFAVLGDEKLAEEYWALYQKTTSLPEGVAYFEQSARRIGECRETGVMQGELGRLLIDYLESFFEHYRPFFENIQPMYAGVLADEKAALEAATTKKEKTRLKSRVEKIEEQRAMFENEWNAFLSLREKYGDYRELAAAVDAISFIRKPTVQKLPDELVLASAFRDGYKERFGSIRNRYFSKSRRDCLDADLEKTARLLYALSRVMTEFEERFSAEKLRHGLLDYADLERYTHRLLVRDGSPTLVAKAVSLSYKEIYIDEYQDVNRLQDEIFSAIAEANRFMVGDIKQSIYGFRGADPALFAGYRSRFDANSREKGKGETIFLSHNFRCDQSVVDFVNLICADLFHAGKTVSYEEGDRLIRGKNEEKDAHVPVEILLLHGEKHSRTDEEEEENALAGSDAEASWIAMEIERLWKEEGIPLSQIAVLFRGLDARLEEFQKAFKERGIPYIHNRAMPFFEEPEVLTILSILHTIDNPTRDIYLAGTLTGPLFGFGLEELMDIRWRCRSDELSDSLYGALGSYYHSEGEKDPRLGEFFAWLEKYRELSCTLSSDELIRKLYSESSLTAIVGADTMRGQAAKQNLRSFYQLARSYEKNNFRGLHRFLRYVQDLSDREQGVERPAQASDAEAVRWMTIHQSKGLEFRVCFLADAAKDFSKQDMLQPFLFHRDKGLTLTLRDETTLGKYHTLPRQLYAQLIKESVVEEEMRLLYVALTRAVERLYVVAWLKSAEKTQERWQMLASRYTFFGVNMAAHYIDWIMASMIAHPEKGKACARTRMLLSTDTGFVQESCEEAELPHRESAQMPKAVQDESTQPVDSSEPLSQPTDVTAEELQKERVDQVVSDLITPRFESDYPYAMVSELPAKLTVSRLTSDILDESEGEELQIAPMVEAPSFLNSAPGQLTGAQKGTATHTFMQFCDFHEVEKNGVESELLRLVNRRFMAPVMADAVNLRAIRRFFTSALYRQMQASSELRREFRFNVQLPAAEFTRDETRAKALESAKLLVQGVVDCCFVLPDGTLKLIDYKTDRLGSDPTEGGKLLWERYANQLYYYKVALEKIFGKTVSEISLYSFYHHQEYVADDSVLKGVST